MECPLTLLIDILRARNDNVQFFNARNFATCMKKIKFDNWTLEIVVSKIADRHFSRAVINCPVGRIRYVRDRHDRRNH